MTLYEYIQQTNDWETTVWDKDYDVEIYFYKENDDDWDKAMNKLAQLLTVTEIGNGGVTVNLSEVIERKLPLLEKEDLFIRCKLNSIMWDMNSILSGYVSECWLKKFVDVLSRKIACFNERKYTFRPCDVENISEEELQERVNKYGKMQYEPNGNQWLVIRGIGYGWEI